MIIIKKKSKPKSATIDFLDCWADGKQAIFDINVAMLSLIKQSREQLVDG